MRTKTFFILLICFAFIISTGCKKGQKTYSIGILQWTEKIESFNETRQGLIDSLAESGYKEGLNLKIFHINAEQDMARAIDGIAEFEDKKVDVIVALGTGSATASFMSIGKHKIPVVYSILGDIRAIKSVENYIRAKHLITGVTMKVSIDRKFRYLQEIMPDIKDVGILYCNEMPEAVTTGKRAFKVSKEMGLNPVEVVIDIEQTERLKEITEAVLSKADVLYIPTDPVLSTPENFRVIIETADRLKKPVVSVSRSSVLNGALFAMHCDFYHLGFQTTYTVIKILEGVSPKILPFQKPSIIMTSLNLRKAQLLGIDIPRKVIARTDNLIE